VASRSVRRERSKGVERRRGESERPEREEQESRKESESSLILDYLTIQCYAFSVRIDVFSTAVAMLPRGGRATDDTTRGVEAEGAARGELEVDDSTRVGGRTT
jgi:hypothetical protein